MIMDGQGRGNPVGRLRALVLALLATLLLGVPSAAAQPACDLFGGIWATGSAKDRTIFYFDDSGSITQRYNVFFERWIDNELVARMYGYFVSSMGLATEALVLEKAYHPFIEDERGDFSDNVLATLAVERVGGTAELPQTLVFAGLNRVLRNLGSDHVDLFADIDDPEMVFVGPNAFAFLACRTQSVNVVSRVAWPISGPVRDESGTHCTATSPGQLAFRRRAGLGGLGIAALDLPLSFTTDGGAIRALMRVDDDYTAWIEAMIVEAESSAGRRLRTILVWSSDPHFIDALSKGRRLRMKVGSDVTFDTDLHAQPGRQLTYALDGSSAALAGLDACIAGARP